LLRSDQEEPEHNHDQNERYEGNKWVGFSTTSLGVSDGFKRKHGKPLVDEFQINITF
jgi:hypothetical protein